MRDDTYASITNALGAIGLTAQQVRPDQLVVSAQEGPVWPNRGNSFWLSCRDGDWFLSTWAPACYRIPGDQDVVTVCSACMKTGTSAMSRVPEEIVTRFGLERISDQDFDRLFPSCDEGSE
jgi:hypothetical protein